ncbi:hypothetical protein [Spirosoma utsteinense]|uniref:Uncharacterized protein n=1 Tax=Spirosoma utsteinense TaxID=2585773 RepID=A0ABR6W3Y4_9BACT|nr:hypothetical protein [Spirosoma utsteinense]MBC3791253.1 hypothetical protein [Spirosoma utsteinense]
MKNQTTTAAPRLTLKKQRIVCLTSSLTTKNGGKTSSILTGITF